MHVNSFSQLYGMFEIFHSKMFGKTRYRSKLFNKTARKIYSYISFKINTQNSII